MENMNDSNDVVIILNSEVVLVTYSGFIILANGFFLSYLMLDLIKMNVVLHKHKSRSEKYDK